MRWKLRGLNHLRGVRMVHEGNVVDCPARRATSDVGTDRCQTCPVFEHLVDDETLAYVVCGIREPALGEDARAEAVSS